jgi:hypothetical protein
MATLQVGNGKQYATIDSAVKAAKDGDTIQVSAGTYKNQYAIIDKDITLTAIGGRVKLESSDNIPNGKGIFVTNGDITINGFDFSGAKVAHKNGAGIRHESGDLVLNNTGFFNNENGIQTANTNRSTDTVTINNSEFAFNGAGSNGQTHNLYVGRMGSLTVNDSYFHDVKGAGHEIKSRADNNIIRDSRIFDNDSGASYSIDLSEGGNATIENNVIQQGQNSLNPTIISYGAEGNLNPGTDLVVKNNKFINDKSGHPLVVKNATGATAQFLNNELYGLNDTQIIYGEGTISGSEFLNSRPNLDKKSPLPGSSNPPPLDPDPEPNPTDNGQSTVGRYWIADVDTDQKIVEIHNGTTFDDVLFAGKSITIIGEGPGESFKLNFDNGTVTRTENVTPYALTGDQNGDLFGGLTLSPGSHTLVTDIYSGGNGTGTNLGHDTVGFFIV